MMKKQKVEEFHASPSAENFPQNFRIIENDQSQSQSPISIENSGEQSHSPLPIESQSQSQTPLALSPPSVPEGIDDIDDEEYGVAKAAAEYSPDVYKYLRYVESISSPSPDYLSQHVETTEKMRTILLDWMAEVHIDFKTWSSSMFLAISILDRYLEANPDISRLKLQLAGIGAMLIASKFEQTNFHSVSTYVEVSDCCYTHDEVLEMELNILKDLNWNVRAPTPLDFLNRLVKGNLLIFCLHPFFLKFLLAARFEDSLQLLSRYILELIVVEYDLLRFKPSIIAASTIYLSRKLTSRKPTWVIFFFLSLYPLFFLIGSYRRQCSSIIAVIALVSFSLVPN
jgi:hypothetical protein